MGETQFNAAPPMHCGTKHPLSQQKLLFFFFFFYPLVLGRAPCRTDPPHVRASKDKKKSKSARTRVAKKYEDERMSKKETADEGGQHGPSESQCIFL